MLDSDVLVAVKRVKRGQYGKGADTVLTAVIAS